MKQNYLSASNQTHKLLQDIQKHISMWIYSSYKDFIGFFLTPGFIFW